MKVHKSFVFLKTNITDDTLLKVRLSIYLAIVNLWTVEINYDKVKETERRKLGDTMRYLHSQCSGIL